MDKACWMCNPGVSSHLNHRVNGGQGEGMEVDSTVGGRLLLEEGGKKNAKYDEAEADTEQPCDQA